MNDMYEVWQTSGEQFIGRVSVEDTLEDALGVLKNMWQDGAEGHVFEPYTRPEALAALIVEK
jgi:hypothetical protein